MKKYLYTFGLLICLSVALPGYAQVDRNETVPPFADWNTK